MNKTKTNLFLICLFIGANLLLAGCCRAQGANSAVLATVDIHNATIVSQIENKIKISFALKNGELVQPGVKYGVRLMRSERKLGQDEYLTLIDEKMYSEIVNLNANSVIKKEIEYAVPDYLNGAYQLWVFAKNESGLTLALNLVSDVTLKGNQKFLEILTSSCYLRVEDETSGKKYAPTEGVDISINEKLIAVCDVYNHFEEKIIAAPRFEVFWRSTFGRQTATEDADQSLLTLDPKQVKTLSVEIPATKEPQAYDVKLSLIKDGEVISNSAYFHYVLAGQSATIQNVRLDKDRYAKNEIALITLDVTGAVGLFPGSRLENLEAAGEKILEITIRDAKNQNCIDPISQIIEEGQSLISAPFRIDCDNFKLAARLKSGEKTLDAREFEIRSAKDKTGIQKSKKSEAVLPIVFFSIIILLLLLLVFLYQKKRGKFPLRIFIFLFISSIFVLNADQASALTFTLYGHSSDWKCENCYANAETEVFCRPCESCVSRPFATVTEAECNKRSICFIYNRSKDPSLPSSPCTLITFPTLSGTLNLNKSAYDPGETITATVYLHNLTCSNSRIEGVIATVQFSATNVTAFSGDISGSTTRVISGPAQSNPGNYVATFYVDAQEFGTVGQTFTIPYTVTGSPPPPPPPPGAPTCSLSFSPSSITSGQSSTGSWSSQNDADGTLNYQCTGDISSGTLPASGSAIVTPSQTQTCTLTAQNSAGQTGTCQATITVGSSPPPAVGGYMCGVGYNCQACSSLGSGACVYSSLSSCQAVCQPPDPPTCNCAFDPLTINKGESTKLFWNESGDSDGKLNFKIISGGYLGWQYSRLATSSGHLSPRCACDTSVSTQNCLATFAFSDGNPDFCYDWFGQRKIERSGITTEPYSVRYEKTKITSGVLDPALSSPIYEVQRMGSRVYYFYPVLESCFCDTTAENIDCPLKFSAYLLPRRSTCYDFYTVASGERRVVQYNKVLAWKGWKELSPIPNSPVVFEITATNAGGVTRSQCTVNVNDSPPSPPPTTPPPTTPPPTTPPPTTPPCEPFYYSCSNGVCGPNNCGQTSSWTCYKRDQCGGQDLVNQQECVNDEVICNNTTCPNCPRIPWIETNP